MPKVIYIRRALRYYANSYDYLREMRAGNPRIGLKGEQAATFSDQEEADDKESLVGHSKKKEIHARSP